MCTVCCKQQAPYTCPRCHKAYCSTACYKGHSQTCSEAFYREQATAQLKATRAGPEQTRQMMEVLQRLQKQQQQQQPGDSYGGGSSSDADSSRSDSDSDGDSDASLVEGPASQLDSIPPALKRLLKRAQREGAAFDVRPSDLTPELVAELESLSLRGQLSHLVTPWEPWWHTDTAAALQLNAAGQRVVQDMEQLHQHVRQQQGSSIVAGAAKGTHTPAGAGPAGSNQGTRELGSGVPMPSEEPLPTLGQLAGQAHRPSLLLPWQLLQLLVAYCAVMRQFNGEPEAAGGWEAAQQLLLLAPPLLQAALVGTSKGGALSRSSDADTAAAAPASPSQQQQQQPSPSIPPPGSVQAACMQLLEAAAAADAPLTWSSDRLQEQLAAVAGAVSSSCGGAPSPERRALLQVATADALKLLQLGRPAVVLALTDSRRMLSAAKEQVKLSLQQASGKGQQLQRQRRTLQALRQSLGFAGQKVWYFMAWANEQDPLVYQVLAEELGDELQGQAAMVTNSSGGGVMLTGKPAVERRAVDNGRPRVVEVVAQQQSVQKPFSSSDLYDLD